MLMILWLPICFPNPPIKNCRDKHELNTEEAKKKEAKRLNKGKRKQVDTSPGDKALAEADALVFGDSWQAPPLGEPTLFGMV